MPRKEKTIHYLYKTICLITGRYYIGIHSTCNLEDGYMGSGKRLKYSIRKHGKENHIKEIVQFFDCREALVEAEKRVISEDDLSNKNCMNLMSGGTGGCYSVKHLESISKLGNEKFKSLFENDEQWRRKYHLSRSNASVKALKNRNDNWRCNWIGKKHSNETKEKMSESSKGMGTGESNSQYGSMWITNDKENKKIKRDGLIPEGWYKGRR